MRRLETPATCRAGGPIDRPSGGRLAGASVIAIGLAALVPTVAAAQQEPAQEEAAAADSSFFSKPPLSPGGAFLRSFVLPGWAQAELGAESRGALYFFAEGFSLFMVARTQARLSWAERTQPENSAVIASRKQQREDWIALAVFTAFFAAADGWVSVHLYGFEERTGVKPEDIAIGVGWRIPIGP
jgi:hypothetical protein